MITDAYRHKVGTVLVYADTHRPKLVAPHLRQINVFGNSWGIGSTIREVEKGDTLLVIALNFMSYPQVSMIVLDNFGTVGAVTISYTDGYSQARDNRWANIDDFYVVEPS